MGWDASEVAVKEASTLVSNARDAYEVLRRAFVLCEIAPGSRVTEPLLAERYDLSRAAVRAALTRLSHQEWIEASPRKGYIVRPLTLKDIRDLFAVRRLLEPAAAEMAARLATEAELADAAALGDKTGMFNCPHTGVALAALIKLLKAGKIDRSERVVVISTAHGLKFVESKVKYHERSLEFACRHANQPIELPPRVDAVKKALNEALRRKGNVRV